MKRLILVCMLALGALVFPGASWESKAQAADGVQTCDIWNPSVGFVDSNFNPTTSASPYAVTMSWQMGCYPTRVRWIYACATNNGSIIGDVQGEAINTYCSSGFQYPTTNTDGASPTYAVAYFICKDNLLSHKQHIDFGGVNWNEIEPGTPETSDGAWGEYLSTPPSSPYHTSPYHMRRCGLD